MLLYRLLAALTLLAYFPVALLQALRGRRALGDIRGRLGAGPYPDLDGGIWIHAVSVGEVGVARNLLEALGQRAPKRRVGVSVTTAAGREVAERTLGGRAAVFPFPFDLARPVETALSRARPGLVLLTETELWPLFLARANARGIPVALVNGRISDRSWPRYLFARRYFAKVLCRISLFAMQSERDAERMRLLGAPPERVRVTGNIKYDLAPTASFPDAERLRRAAAGRPVVAAASTAEGEEEIVLAAWEKLSPRPLLALAPRRPERFDETAMRIGERGHRLMRRTGTSPEGADVYLLDSVGELASLYREAAVAFVGGSLVPKGGHNPIEAWAAGVPVIVGPHTHNFEEVTRRGEELGILRVAANGEDLFRALGEALADPEATSERGARAGRFVSENRGAAAATADLVLPLLEAPARNSAS